METIKTRGHSTGKVTYPAYTADQERLMAANRRGEGLVLPAHFEAVADGRMFVANVGTATTPINFAKTSYDADQPQFVIDVPSGTKIIPISLKVVLETEAGTLNEVIWSTSSTLTGVGSSTAVTAVNARIQAASSAPTTACSLYSLYTGNGTAPSGGYEFARWAKPFVLSDGDPQDPYIWNAAQEGWGPQLEGESSLLCHIAAASTAATGYLTAVWWEMDTN